MLRHVFWRVAGLKCLPLIIVLFGLNEPLAVRTKEGGNEVIKQRLKILLKMCVRFDIDQACAIKNELMETYSIVQKGPRIKSK